LAGDVNENEITRFRKRQGRRKVMLFSDAEKKELKRL